MNFGFLAKYKIILMNSNPCIVCSSINLSFVLYQHKVFRVISHTIDGYFWISQYISILNLDVGSICLAINIFLFSTEMKVYCCEQIFKSFYYIKWTHLSFPGQVHESQVRQLMNLLQIHKHAIRFPFIHVAVWCKFQLLKSQ